MLNIVVRAVIPVLIGVAALNEARAQEPECGQVSVARMNWPSAELIAEIDRFVLGTGYGCEVQFISGDTLQIVESMINEQSPDLAPELWLDTLDEQSGLALESGDIIRAARVFADGALEGWWIPRYVVEQSPNITSVEDALSHPELFPAPDDESTGAIYNCPQTWKACQIATTNLFTAYRAEEHGFKLIEAVSAASLDGSIARAYQSKVGWLGYYWSPTAVLGRYDMVRLDMGDHKPDHWETCTTVADCESPQVNAWAESEVYSAITRRFSQSEMPALEYIRQRQWDNRSLSQLLAWMADHQASGEEAALHFLSNHHDAWVSWVSPRARASIQAALP